MQAANATTAFDAIAPTTTQGDLIYHNGTDNVRLAKGTAGQVLTMNAGATAPEWAAGGGGGGGGARVFEVVVAASDSVSTTGADYVCDGTDDDVQIQAAIDAVSAAGGGTVYLREGHYYYTSNPILPKNYVSVVGESRNGTILAPSWTATRSAFGDGTNSGAFTSGTPLTDFELRNLTIDCTNASASSYTPACKGVFIQYLQNCTFDNLNILESYASALGIDYLVNTKITNIYILNHGRGMNPAGSSVGGNGIGIGTGGYAVETCYVANVQVLVNNGRGNNGIMFESQNTSTNSQHMVVDGFQITGSYTGLRVSGVESVSFSDGRVISPQQDGIIITDGINGNGKASNKLRFSDIVVTGAARNALRFAFGGSDMEFNGCTFSGSTSTNILFNTSMTDIRFNGGQSNGSAVHGVSMALESTAVRFNGFNVFGNTSDGYNIGACIDLSIIGGSSWDNGGDGIDLDGIQGPVNISGVSLYLNDSQGVLATNVNRTTINNCQIYLNADSGITFNNTSASARNLVSGNVITNNGTNTGLTYRSAIVLLGSGALTYSTFQNNITSDSQGTQTQRFGLVPQSSNRSFCVFQNNDFRGNLTGAVSTGTAGTNEIRKNNLGLNPEGGAAITVTASPFTYTAGTSPEMVYIYGGTVSDVSKSSATIATASGISVHLEPNQAITVTYTVAPTMRKDRL